MEVEVVMRALVSIRGPDTMEPRCIMAVFFFFFSSSPGVGDVVDTLAALS